jgi:nucleoside-diphosphate-sugar epimerase
MRILVTGGAGYLGSILCPALLQSGASVTVLDNFRYGQNSLLDCCADSRLQVIRGDSRDKRILEPLVKHSDITIPLAALVGAPVCDGDAIAARTTNQDAVIELCRLHSNSQSILFPTTNSGYGIGAPGSVCTEESPLRPISLYGVTKVAAEAAVLERENSLSFRLATVFGVSPRMRNDLLVNDFVHRACSDRAVVIFEGHFKRNYIHVRDVARAFLHGITEFTSMKGRCYNVGLDDANLSKLELCAEIKKQVPAFTYLEAPIGEDPDKRDYVVSNARIAATGFQAKYSLRDGIAELIRAHAILQGRPYSNLI